MKSYILVAAILLFICGCKPKAVIPKTTTVSGQVFIVTRGAENIKLGAVEILLIEEQAAREFLRKLKESQRAAFVIANAQYKKVNAAYMASRTDTALYEEAKQASFRRDVLEKKLEDPPTTEEYSADLSEIVVQKTLTDADGRFSFICPRNKSFTIFASAHRTVFDKTEMYCWWVNAPTTAEKAQLFLSNNNQTSIDPDHYLK